MLAARKDMDGYKEELSRILRFVIYFMLPVTFGFMAVRHQFINLLYGWGKVTGDNIATAGGLMACYALGVTGVGLKEVLDRAFYSLKDTRRPAINGVIVMVVNIVSSLILITIMGVFGIPLAYSISAVTGALVLIFLLRRKIGGFGLKSLAASLVKVGLCAAGMFFVLLPLNALLEGVTMGPALLDRLLKLLVPVAVGGVVYFLLTLLLRVEETRFLVNGIKSRLRLT